MVKRGVDRAAAQTYHEALEVCGLQAHVEAVPRFIHSEPQMSGWADANRRFTSGGLSPDVAERGDDAAYVPPAERVRQESIRMDAQFRAAAGRHGSNVEPMETRVFTAPRRRPYVLRVGLVVVVIASGLFLRRCFSGAALGASISRSAEENAALALSENESLSDEEAIEQIVATCLGSGAVMEFELNGDPGDYGAYVKYERSGATIAGSEHGFRDLLMRELGRISVCAFRAGETRGLALMEYEQTLDTGPVTIVGSIEHEELEQVPGWRDTSISPFVNVGDLHLEVASRIAIEQDWIHTLAPSGR